MRKIALFVIAVLSCIAIDAQEIKLSNYIKGEW